MFTYSNFKLHLVHHYIFLILSLSPVAVTLYSLPLHTSFTSKPSCIFKDADNPLAKGKIEGEKSLRSTGWIPTVQSRNTLRFD